MSYISKGSQIASAIMTIVTLTVTGVAIFAQGLTSHGAVRAPQFVATSTTDGIVMEGGGDINASSTNSDATFGGTVSSTNAIFGSTTTTRATSTDLYATTLRTSSTLFMRGLQTIYVPDQTNFVGSMFGSSGGSLLSHTVGTEGQLNTSFGINTLSAITTGYKNTAIGGNALDSVTTGFGNVAIGSNALQSVVTTTYSFGLGNAALNALVGGSGNIAIGNATLYNQIDANGNIAIGNAAGRYWGNMSTPLIPLSNNIYIGITAAGYNNLDSNSIVIGASATGTGANTTVLGNFSTTGTTIFGTTNIIGNLTARGGSAGKAMCWKADGTTLGYCSSVVGVDGSCTCN